MTIRLKHRQKLAGRKTIQIGLGYDLLFGNHCNPSGRKTIQIGLGYDKILIQFRYRFAVARPSKSVWVMTNASYR